MIKTKHPSKIQLLISSLVFLALAALTVSCATGAKRLAGTGIVVPDGEVMVVGKFIIDPIPEGYERKPSMYGFHGETVIDFGGKSQLGGQFHMFLDRYMRPSTGRTRKAYNAWPENMKLMAYEGETFYIMLKKIKYFGIAAAFYMERDGEAEFIFAPAAFALDIQPGDKAIYIGTIKYTRDLYYEWKNVEVIDEYNSVLPDFRKKFAASVKLRKTLTHWLGSKGGKI